jgi:peptidase S46-like protein
MKRLILCVRGLADNSSAERDLIANGYIAARLEDELRCQGARASVLLSTENITDRVVRRSATSSQPRPPLFATKC